MEETVEKSVKAIYGQNGAVSQRIMKSNDMESTMRAEQLTMMHSILSATDNFEIAVHDGEEGSTLHLRGRLNIDSSPAFRDRLMAMLQAKPPQAVIVDFSDVSYVDSSGIATLIEGLKMARQRQTTLCLRGLQGRLLHLFDVTGMSTLFEKSGCGSASSESKVS